MVDAKHVFAACTAECASFYQSLMYGAVAAAAVVQFFRIRSRSREWTAQLLFHLFISLVTIMRTIADLLIAFSIVDEESTIFYMLWSTPGVLFFSTYSLLVFEWARVLHLAHDARPNLNGALVRKVFMIAANVIAYLIQIALFALLFWPRGSPTRQWFLTSEPIWLAVVALVSCFAFLFYGCHLYNLFARKLWKSDVQRTMGRSIFIATLFCTFCFLLRGVVNLAWTHTVTYLRSCSMLAFYIAFYFVIEIMPSIAVLYVMGALPKRQHSTNKLLNRLPAHLQVVPRESFSAPLLRDGEYDFGTRSSYDDPTHRSIAPDGYNGEDFAY